MFIYFCQARTLASEPEIAICSSCYSSCVPSVLIRECLIFNFTNSKLYKKTLIFVYNAKPSARVHSRSANLTRATKSTESVFSTLYFGSNIEKSAQPVSTKF